MRWILPAVVVLAGCGSSWQIRKDEVLEVGCPEKLYYLDMDRDGWGDGSSTPISSCHRVDDYQATNGRDCDDGDEEVTGRVGGVCPDGLIGGSVPDYRGVRAVDSEFVFVFGEATPTVPYAVASAACGEWSASDLVGDEWIPRGTLAVPGDRLEVEALQSAVVDALVGDPLGVFAGFIGIGWNGSFDTNSATFTGGWDWIDDNDFDLIAREGWCDGPVSPADFFPRLNPLCDGSDPEMCGDCEDPEDPVCGNHQAAFIDELPHMRLALVYRGGSDWCVGLPRDAIPDDLKAALDNHAADPSDPEVQRWEHLTHTRGHFICERPAPDPVDYEEYTALAED